MAGLDDLARGDLTEIKRRLRILETAAPLQNASIGADGLRVYDGGVITIENGGLKVTGSIDVIGELIASGIITFTGTLTQEGESTFTGPTHLEGDTDVTGTLDVQGATTLNADLAVGNEGKITAGNTVIDPSASNGGVTFASGGGVGGNAGSVAVRGSGNAGLITGDVAAIFAGATQINVGDGSVSITGLPTISGVTSNLYMDPSTKQIKRIT